MLMGAQGVSMVLSFLFTILIAKQLDVATYGTFRYAMTYLALTATVLQFGWPYSAGRLLALASDRVTQARIVGACVALVAGASLFGTLGTVVAFFVAGKLGYELPRILLWVGPFLYVTLGQQMLTNICQGLNRIPLLAAQQVVPYAILLPVTVVQVFLLHSYSLGAAVAGYVAVFSGVIVLGVVRAGVSFDGLRAWTRAIRNENRATGMPIYVGGIFGVASAQLIALWVTQFTTPEQYGHFALALAVSTPLGVMVSSIGTVIFRSSASEASLSRRVLAYSFGFGALLLLAFLVVIQTLLTRVFGSQYGPSVPLAQVMGIGSLMIGWGDIFQRFLGAKGRGTSLGRVAVCTGLIGVTSAAFLLPSRGAAGAALSSVFAAVTYLGLMLVLYSRRRGARGTLNPPNSHDG
jgi:O-antigen/teichoic acid export membrane protein